jgi:hypothetical protein
VDGHLFKNGDTVELRQNIYLNLKMTRKYISANFFPSVVSLKNVIFNALLMIMYCKFLLSYSSGRV